MKVVIDIPKDFTGDYIVDKFRDFFSRVIADIDCKGMCAMFKNLNINQGDSNEALQTD